MELNDFKKAMAESAVTCAICGFKAHSLVAHLKEMHKLSPGQYESRYPDQLYVSDVLLRLSSEIKREPYLKNTALSDMKTIFDVQVHEKVLTDLKKKNKVAPVGVDHYIQLGDKLEKGDPAYQGYAHKGSLDEGFVFDEEVISSLLCCDGVGEEHLHLGSSRVWQDSVRLAVSFEDGEANHPHEYEGRCHSFQLYRRAAGRFD